jgi:uncharacterized protein (TIGR02246 family)
MTRILILATVGSIVLVGTPVRAQVETREMPMPPIAESPSPAAYETPAATPIADATDDFAEVREEYRDAATSHDAARLAGLFADDAVLVASDQDVFRGRQEIEKYFSSVGGQPLPVVTLTGVRAESRNGFGSETGQFEERVTSSEGTVSQVTGVYLTIYRRDDEGRWRVAIAIRSRGDQQPLGLW